MRLQLSSGSASMAGLRTAEKGLEQKIEDKIDTEIDTESANDKTLYQASETHSQCSSGAIIL